MTDEYVPKMVHLPGTRLSPEVVLHRTLAKLPRIKSVVIVIQWDDDTFDTDWSQMKVSELACCSLILNKDATDTLCNGAHRP